MHTSIARVKNAGWWCENADEITDKLAETMGVAKTDELPMGKVVELLGVVNGLIFIGAPHPRFKAKADEVLSEFSTLLVDTLSDRFPEENLSPFLKAYERDLSPVSLAQTWASKLGKASTPFDRMAYGAVAMLLRKDWPKQVRLAQSVKHYLASIQNDSDSIRKKFLDFLVEKCNG